MIGVRLMKHSRLSLRVASTLFILLAMAGCAVISSSPTKDNYEDKHYIQVGGFMFDMGPPELVSYSEPNFSVVYSDINVGYELLTPKTYFLGAVETGDYTVSDVECLIRTAFEPKQSCELTDELRQYALADSLVSGIFDGSAKIIEETLKTRSGNDADLLASHRVYSGTAIGHVYIFEDGKIHHLSTGKANYEKFSTFIESIKPYSYKEIFGE